MASGHACAQTTTVYFQRNESLGITDHCGNGKVSLPALGERAQEDKDPAFVNSASTKKAQRVISDSSSLAAQECACVRTLFILALLPIYKLKQIVVETFATMEKGCLQSGRKQTK